VKLFVLISAVLLTGCASTSNMQVGPSTYFDENAANFVAIGDSIPNDAEPVGPVEASRCQRNSLDASISDDMVLHDLQIAAYAKRANGIASISITKESGLLQNCWYVLKGRALAYKTKNAPIHPEDVQKVFDQQDEMWAEQLENGEITLVQYSRNVFELAKKLDPQAAQVHAFNAYRVYAAKQLEDKKITQEEYDYRVSEKYAELVSVSEEKSRQNGRQQVVNGQHVDPTPFLLYAIGQSFKNAYQPPPRNFVNCTSNNFGGSISTTCY